MYVLHTWIHFHMQEPCLHPAGGQLEDAHASSATPNSKDLSVVFDAHAVSLHPLAHP